MCILKNPNSDVKDKEVPEHRFCECYLNCRCVALQIPAIGLFWITSENISCWLCKECFDGEEGKALRIQ